MTIWAPLKAHIAISHRRIKSVHIYEIVKYTRGDTPNALLMPFAICQRTVHGKTRTHRATPLCDTYLTAFDSIRAFNLCGHEESFNFFLTERI